MVCDAVGVEPGGGAGTVGSSRPRGNPNLAPRCGAQTRAGLACRGPGMANGRCRIHGGKSTGPRTAKGLANLAAAHTTGGAYSAASWARQRYIRTLAQRTRLLVAARQLQAYLPPEVAARLATVPAELWAPVHYSQTPKPEITTKTLWTGGRDARGRFTARPVPVLRGRAAELEAARAQRAALAPWRAAIAGARLVKRAVLAARRAARIEKHDKDPMRRRLGACLGTGIAAAMDVPGQQDGPGHGDGRTLEVGGGEAGRGPGIGEIVQRPDGPGPGAGMGATPSASEALGDSTGGMVPRRMAGTTPGTSARGQGLPAMTKSSPCVTNGPPGMTKSSPGMANGSPAMTNSAPSVANGSPAMTNSAPALANRAPGMMESAPAMVKNENGDKDPMNPRAVRWRLDGLKGRLYGSTSQASGAARVDDWRAVLRASNAVRDRGTWTLHGIRPAAPW